MEMIGRGFHGDYRFGYQGSFRDDEIAGEGNSITTEFRQLDPRLGRWFSVDPVFQPWQSPYTSMDNNPVSLNDPKGLDPKKEKNGKTSNDGKGTDGPSFIKRIATKAGRAIQYGFNWMTGQQYKNDAYADADKLGISRKDVKFGKDKKTGERYAYHGHSSGDVMDGTFKNSFTEFWRGGKKEETAKILDGANQGSTAGTGIVLYGTGQDLKIRREMYEKPYLQDIRLGEKTPAQIALDRYNRILETRLKLTPWGYKSSDLMKPLPEAWAQTQKKIAAGTLGVTNPQISSMVKYSPYFKVAGSGLLIYSLSTSASNVVNSNFDSKVVTREVGGTAGALMWGSTGAYIGAFGGPLDPITIPLCGAIGGGLGYFFGSGDAAEMVSGD